MSPASMDRMRQLVARVGLGAAGQLPPSVRRAINTARGIQTPHLVDCLRGEKPVVIAPHPDDELIGAGGAMAAHAHRGHPPHIFHVTSGERTAGLAHLPSPERAPTREGEARAAAAHLGLDHRVQFLRLPDGGIDPDDRTHVDALARALATIDPDLIYAPWPLDPHRDHVAVSILVHKTLAQLDLSPTIALYEVWSPLVATHVVDIGDHLDTKLAALAEYRSALESVDYLHTAKGLAAYRSGQGQHGRGYAEAFSVMSTGAFAELLAQRDRSSE